MSTNRYARLPTDAAERTLRSEHYDYTHQAWIGADGRYLCCNHPPSKDCSCYGRLHAGELAPIEHERLPHSERCAHPVFSLCDERERQTKQPDGWNIEALMLGIDKEKCRYCLKPIDAPVARKIIDRTFDHTKRKQVVREQTLNFCSAECGLHYQMGCEG